MKTMKIVSVMFLSVLLITMSFISAFASVVPAITETNSGEVVTVQFNYDNIAGIRGTFTITGDEIIKKFVFKANDGFTGNYNAEEGIIAYFASSAKKFVGTLELTIADTAAVGDECKITLEYETTADGKLPTTPVYKYDYATIKIGADYTELNKQIAIAKKLDQDDYTVNSWKVLENALKEAEKAKNSNVQATVDAAAKSLADAIAGLKLKPTVKVDYTELDKQVAIAQGLDKSKYTADSWKVLQKALEKVNEAKKSNSQAVVDAAAKELEDAIKSLKLSSDGTASVNYKKLRKLIDTANDLDEDKYTSKSWNKFEIALENAIAALSADSQDVVDEAYDQLSAAIKNLKTKKADTIIESPATQDVSNTVVCLIFIAVIGLLFVCVSNKKIKNK